MWTITLKLYIPYCFPRGSITRPFLFLILINGTSKSIWIILNAFFMQMIEHFQFVVPDDNIMDSAELIN